MLIEQRAIVVTVAFVRQDINGSCAGLVLLWHILQQLVDEVDVREDHPAAAVARQPNCRERLAVTWATWAGQHQ
jgi:hypothetical protein